MIRARRDWVAIVLFGLFLVGRIVIVLRGKVFTSFDTFSYAYRHDPQWDRGALVSFVGHAPRPWGVPLYFVMFGDDHARAVGQWLLGTAAWGALALAVSAFLVTRAARLTAIALILLLGLTRTVASWDFAILSESLSLSLGVATLAFFLWWVRTRAIWPLAVCVVLGVWWIFTRVDMFLMAVPLCFALAWFAWRRRQADWRAPVVAALLLTFACAWSYLVVGPASLQAQGKWSFDPALSHDRGLLMYRLRLNVYGDPEVKAAFERDLGMPDCPAADQFVKDNPGWEIDRFAAAVDSCPQLRAWTDQHVNDMWTRYATTMPALFGKQLAAFTGNSLAGAAYADVPAVVPVLVEKALFAKRFVLLVTAGVLAAGIGLALASGARRRHRELFVTAIVLAATALASAVLTVLVSSGEVWRFGLQEAVAIRVAAILLLVISLDSWLAARTATHIDAMSRSTRSS